MWLTNVDHAWDGYPEDDIRGAILALQLLDLTQLILQDGENWTSCDLARTFSSECCDPLSSKAFYFSLTGAAAKARWSMREEVADSEVNPIHLQQLMSALRAFEVQHCHCDNWAFFNAFLQGLQSTLVEYVRIRDKGEFGK